MIVPRFSTGPHGDCKLGKTKSHQVNKQPRNNRARTIAPTGAGIFDRHVFITISVMVLFHNKHHILTPRTFPEKYSLLKSKLRKPFFYYNNKRSNRTLPLVPCCYCFGKFTKKGAAHPLTTAPMIAVQVVRASLRFHIRECMEVASPPLVLDVPSFLFACSDSCLF